MGEKDLVQSWPKDDVIDYETHRNCMAMKEVLAFCCSHIYPEREGTIFFIFPTPWYHMRDFQTIYTMLDHVEIL